MLIILQITEYLGHSEKDLEKNGSFQGDLTKADLLKSDPSLATQRWFSSCTS